MTTTSSIDSVLQSVLVTSDTGEKLIRRLTKAAGFSSDNVVARLAVCRSLQEGGLLEPKKDWATHRRGKQLRGSTLLGRKDMAVVPLILSVLQAGAPSQPSDLREMLRLHLERGLRLMERDVATVGSFEEMLIAYLPSTDTAALSMSPDDTLGSLDKVIGQEEPMARLRGAAEAWLASGRASFHVAVMAEDGFGRGFVARSLASALRWPLLDLRGMKEELSAAKLMALLRESGARIQETPDEGANGLPPFVVRTAGEARPLVLPGGAQWGRWIELREVHWDADVSAWAGPDYVIVRMVPYARDEVAAILQAVLGRWSTDTRRGLALAGRLIPGQALERAKEFRAFLEQRRSRASERLLLEMMRDVWHVDRLGLAQTDYDVLMLVSQEESSKALSRDGDSYRFLIALGALQESGDGVSLTATGDALLSARAQEKL